MSNSIVAGKIDRISGSGNAMLCTGSDEYNLGPLPNKVVDNLAIAVPLSGFWAVCITPYIQKDQYLSGFVSTTGMSRSEVKKAILRAGPSISNYFNDDFSVSNFFDGDLPSQPKEKLVEGDSFEVQIVASGSEGSYVVFDDGSAIEIDVPFLPPGHETTVEITNADSPIRSAIIDESILQDAPTCGTKLTAEILGTNGSTAYALHESTPVFLPDVSASKDDHVHVAVVSKGTNGIEATVAALPESERLSIGDSFELKLNLSPSDSDMTFVHRGEPIQISAPTFPLRETVPVTVTEVKSNVTTVKIDFAILDKVKFETGQKLSIEQLERRGNRLIGKCDGVPFTLSATNSLPSMPDSLDVVISDISSDEISVTIREHPLLESLQSKDIISVSIDAEKTDHLFGEYRSFPVWIPFDGKITPSELTVAITCITDYGIFASVADLPENAVPEAGQIVSAEIKKKHSSAATACLETANDVDPYAIPVLLPLLKSDIQGKVGVEIIGRGDSHLSGILRTTNVSENADPVSTYLVEIQRALVVLRYQSPAEAVSGWKSAAKETNSELREIDAKRSAIYSEVEEASKTKDNKKAISLLTEFRKYLKHVDVPTGYRDDLENELDAYNQLITVNQRESRDSLTGLQRIAYNVTTQS